MSSIGKSTLRGSFAAGMTGALRKHLPKLIALRKDNRTNTSDPAVLSHKIDSFTTNEKVFVIVSNLRTPSNCFRRLIPRRVRSIALLGSTTTATLCNGEKTGNILIVAAGEKRANKLGVGFDTGINFRRTAHLPGFMSTCGCTGLCGRTLIGSKKSPLCSGRTLSTCHAKDGSLLCPGIS